MKNRIWLGLVLTLAAGFMLNACGKGDSGNNNGTVATTPIGAYGTCPNGINQGATGVNGYPYNGAYGNQGYPNQGYPIQGYPNNGGFQQGVPTTNYWGNTGLSYSYSYQYQYGYGNPGYINPGYQNQGYQNPGYVNPAYGNQAYGYNNPNLALANTGCNSGVGYAGGGMCNAQQVCTNMGQPGLVHYGIGCYPACGPCMANVNGQCLPGI
jgi:hypothetical protein